MIKKNNFKKDLRRLCMPSAKEAVQVEALFSVAYAIKFKVKKALAIDYDVLLLEGLWWSWLSRSVSTRTSTRICIGSLYWVER